MKKIKIRTSESIKNIESKSKKQLVTIKDQGGKQLYINNKQGK